MATRLTSAGTLLLLAWCALPGQEVIDISVRGISDAANDGAQKDRLEAILDAKRQACEKAGMTISSKTTVENFKAVFDLVETQAEAVLLPGFTVIDVGYMADGTFAVVLTGKLKRKAPPPPPPPDQARYTILIWFDDKDKDIADKTDALDKLYAWLGRIHATYKLGDTPLDKLEDNLAQVAVSDSGKYGSRRFYALTYSLPVGDMVYAQRTPNMGGGESAYDYSTKLRAGKQYIMTVAAIDAVYFKAPEAFEGSRKLPDGSVVYPDHFRAVYPAAK